MKEQRDKNTPQTCSLISSTRFFCVSRLKIRRRWSERGRISPAMAGSMVFSLARTWAVQVSGSSRCRPIMATASVRVNWDNRKPVISCFLHDTLETSNQHPPRPRRLVVFTLLGRQLTKMRTLFSSLKRKRGLFFFLVNGTQRPCR